MYALITVFFIAAKRKEIFLLFDDFRKRCIPAQGKDGNPPFAACGCARGPENPI